MSSHYREVIRTIFKQYPQKHQEIIQDFHDWIDDKYEIPVTTELRGIIRKIVKED